ncbi:MAG: ABA4-like family protein [Pseudomonadota bacterium]
MDADLGFQIANTVCLWGWLALLASPWIPTWADRLAGFIIPGLVSVAYVILIVMFMGTTDGGYFTLDDVIKLFSSREVVLAGWLHVIAFDLFVGAWIVRTARAEAIAFVWVVPCLIMTFLFGPAGFLAFLALRGWKGGRENRAATA